MNRNFELSTGRGSDLQRPTELGRPSYFLQSRPTSSRTESWEWLRAIDILKNHWRLSTLFALIVVMTVTVATLMMRPVFEPEARLEVDPPGAEVFSLQGNNNSGPSIDYMETQAQNLQSDELALEVIRKLRLDQNPDFGGDPNAIAAVPSQSGGVAVPLAPAENKALFAFKQSRKITRDTASRLISVGMAAHDPMVAAAVTNTLVNMFIERDYKLRNNAISQSSQWLQRQLDDIRQRVDNSNAALSNFEKENGISTIGDNQNRFSDEMLELSRQLMQAQADRIQLQSYLNGSNEIQASALPQISGDPVVQELKKRLAGVRAEIAQTRAVYGENHPNTKKLQNEADELQSQLNAQQREIVRDLETSYMAAQARVHLMQSQMQGASRQMIVLAQYNALKKEADANVQLYEALYQKIKEAAIAAATKSSNIRVVDRARVLDRPTRPHRLKNIATGLLAGILGGVIVAFLREGIDTRIRTPEDMKRCLEVESVSVVPVIDKDEAIRHIRQRTRLLPSYEAVFSADGADGPINALESPHAFQIDRPNSPEGEALRGICVSVRLSRRNGSPPKVFLIVSPMSGEGKTTISVNLALTLARHGRTCIVDADLRKEGVAPALDIVAEHGLREVLSGTMEVDQVLVPVVQSPNLSLLASGSVPGEPGSLIASTAMTSLVEKLRQKFEFIVIDSPPILPFADSRALSAVVDGIIMVGRSGVTTRENLKRAMELLRGVRSAPVIELVLNAAEYSLVDYGYYRYGVTV